jgi:hypothetical protein
MTDAAPSNAGDRYHFVYAAKRMLDMLPPNSKLSLVHMENIARIDQDLIKSPDDLLGVDLSEYRLFRLRPFCYTFVGLSA